MCCLNSPEDIELDGIRNKWFQSHILMQVSMLELCLISFNLYVAAVAEWLRRLTRNQLGSARVGSNPTGRDLFS